LTGHLVPDFKTIADFRKDNGKAIREVCRAFVALCRELDLLSEASVAIDGSKFKAVNARDKNFTEAKMKRRLERIEESIARYIAQLETADRRGDPMPEAKVARFKDKIAKLNGEIVRLSVINDEMVKSKDWQISLTNPDARSMATSGKDTGIVGYNVQAAVDTKSHLIVAHEVTNVGTDRHKLSNMAEQARSQGRHENKSPRSFRACCRDFPDFLDGDTPVSPTGPFDIERILKQVRAVALPQAASVIPRWTGALGTDGAVAEAKRSLMVNKAIGIGALVGAGAGFVVVPSFAIAWIAIGLYGLFKLFGSAVDFAPFKTAFALADQRARDAEIAFIQRIGLTELYGVRGDLEKWIASHRQLNTDLNRDLANLRSTRESRQRDAFLDRFPIRTAKISGIGPAKTATLASFGIETAADVNETAVRAVPGFGEAMTAKMVAWRRTHEARFRYNPAPSSADAQAEHAVRAASAAKRTDLQTKINSGLAALQSGPQRVAVRAQTVDQPLMAALGERARAAHNLQLLVLPVPFSAPITIAPKSSPSPTVAQSWTPTGGKPAQGVPTCLRWAQQ
jgi:hypothetical protein